jgi:orotate phosphoribosyltransferase
MKYREELRQLLKAKSCVRGSFVLSSGEKSDYYIDCKLTTLDAKGAFLTASTILDLLKENGIQADAIGGPEIGAIPIVAAVAAVSYVRAEKEGVGRPLPSFLVRKERKAHGRQRQIEGIDLKSVRKVVMVDEVCTTAASIEVALQAAEEAGLEVVAVIALVDRQQGGHLRLREKYGDRYFPIFTAAQLFEGPKEDAVKSGSL